MIAHALKAAFCKCGALSTAKEMAFWGECRSCRMLDLRTRKPIGNGNEAVEKAEYSYNGTDEGGEW